MVIPYCGQFHSTTCFITGPGHQKNIEAAINQIAERTTKPSESIHFMGVSSAEEVKEGIWKLEESVAKV